MCNLFRTSVLQRRHFEPKLLKRQDNYLFIFMSEVTDIPLLIRKYCIIKKARVKLATELTLFMHFLCLL